MEIDTQSVVLTTKKSPYGSIDFISIPGMSGSPVYVRKQLVGILSSYTPSDTTSTVLFLDQEDIALRIQQHLDTSQ